MTDRPDPIKRLEIRMPDSHTPVQDRAVACLWDALAGGVAELDARDVAAWRDLVTLVEQIPGAAFMVVLPSGGSITREARANVAPGDHDHVEGD